MINNPVYDPAHDGDVDGVLTWLRANPESINEFVGEGYGLLHVACLFGHEKLVAELLGRGALVNVNADNASRTTPLHAAVAFRDEVIADRIARQLIDNGAELNAQQLGGETPLHHAVARGSLRLTEMLVLAGADPFLKDEAGRTPSVLAQSLEDGDASMIREALKRAFALPVEP
jgi:ankyrin repeat protein